jgi:type II secretory ATPase GspE/PulE/Tfp pilus assembly ATPase PilB-like protein
VHGAGCEECNNSGFKGQIGVFELLVFDDDLRHKVWSRTSIDLESVAEFSPMISDALQKVRDHVTTLEEVIRTVPIPD